MTTNLSRYEALSPEESLCLLRQAQVGRIVYTQRALPAIEPVNFIIDRGDVVIRSSTGSKLSTAIRNAVVAFEVDEIDPARRTGWSVIITGQARLVCAVADIVHLESSALEPWAAGDRPCFIRISIDLISGRRLVRLLSDVSLTATC